MIQVGIVHQSGPMLEWLKLTVRNTPDFGVAWSASTGDGALSRQRERPVDVLLFELALPHANSPDLIRKLMAVHPSSVLLLADDPAASRELLFAVFGKGAVDVVPAPPLNDPKGTGELRRKLVMLGRILPVDAAGRQPGGRVAALAAAAQTTQESWPNAIIGIGASTGGPQALAEVLGGLPADLSAAVVVVQHLDRAFLPRLQTWLQVECVLPVLLASEGQLLRSGTVLVADTDDHLVLRERGGRVSARYQPASGQQAHRPSIDVFFQSMVELRDISRCGVLLTGMGRDGAAGLLALRNSGALTLAQDKESSVVFGMPRAALAVGAVSELVPLSSISAHLLQFARSAAPVAETHFRRE